MTLSRKLRDVLRLMRVFHGLKQCDLAARLKLSPSYLSELEAGKKDVMLDLLETYAKVFKVRVHELVWVAEWITPGKSSGITGLSHGVVDFVRWLEHPKIKARSKKEYND